VFREGPFTGAVFEQQPTDEEVILNIPRLWDNSRFLRAAQQFRNNGFGEALWHFKEEYDQQEVICSSAITSATMVALSGVPTDFDELTNFLDSAQQDDLWKICVSANLYPNEALRISKERTQHLIQKWQNRWR